MPYRLTPCLVGAWWPRLAAFRYITVISYSLLGLCFDGIACAESAGKPTLAPGAETIRSWDKVSAERKEDLRGFVGRVDLSTDEPISEEDARLLATVRGDLVIEAPGVTPAAAKILCSGRSSLNLIGLSGLSPELAEALGTCAGPLYLPECHDLSPMTVRTLLAGNRYGLRIGGLRLTAEHARSIENCRGMIELGQVSLLDEHAAHSLVQYRGKLDLWLVELSAAAARALGDGGERLGIGLAHGPVRLTRSMAADLSKHAGRLTLASVSFEPDPETVLTELSRHRGELDLSFVRGARPLTLGEAMALSGQREAEEGGGDTLEQDADKLHHAPMGDLTLRLAAENSTEVAKVLASRRGGKLCVKLQEPLTETVARALALHKGPLVLEHWSLIVGAERPPAEAVAALCTHSGSLELPADWISPDTIDAVVSHKGGLTIYVPRTSATTVTVSIDPTGKSVVTESRDTTRWMAAGLMTRVASSDGPLHIKGDPPDAIVQIVATRRCDLALAQIPRGEIGLRALLQRKGRLFFTEDSSVNSVAAAKVFASAANKTTVCTSTHMIGPDAKEIATILTTREGPLSFPYLRYIDADALRTLATKTDVRLPPLDRVYILSEHGLDVEPTQVVSEAFLRINADNLPPQEIPKWHSWDRLCNAIKNAEPGVGADSR